MNQNPSTVGVARESRAAREARVAGLRNFSTPSLEDVERRTIVEALNGTNWVISGSKGAAALLGLKRSTLQARMEKLGIRRARAAQLVAQ